MRNTLPLISVFALGLLYSTLAIADDAPLGQIISAGATTNNSTTVTPFAVANTYTASLNRVSIQCSAATYVAVGVGSGVTATAANVLVDVNQLYDILLTNDPVTGALQNSIAILPVAGGADTCKVFKVVK